MAYRTSADLIVDQRQKTGLILYSDTKHYCKFPKNPSWWQVFWCTAKRFIHNSVWRCDDCLQVYKWKIKWSDGTTRFNPEWEKSDIAAWLEAGGEE